MKRWHQRNSSAGRHVQGIVGGIVLRGDKPKKNKTTCKPRSDSAGNDSYNEVFEYGLVRCTQERETAGTNEPTDTANDARAYYLRGLSHEKRGEYTRAIRDYNRAISLDPRLAWAYYHRGIAHGSRGNSRQQVKDLRTAARLGLWIAVDMLAVCDRSSKKTRRA
ncbi:MAG: peptidase caspase catalytic subunit p20 [Deltaproteobacteria bacterium]|nr:peptidase caspase catalytic subunit p20 [Deltaproteobacteria bacterium]